MTNIRGGRLARLTKLASVGVRTGASLLLEKGSEAAAGQAAEALGQLRALAAKVGQMAGYVDGVIPEESRAAYEKALSTLQSAAPASSSDDIRRFVESELGAPIDHLFAEWEDAPLASASIGQVHRARLHGDSGAKVAVKVQHPGVARALEADLANAGLIEKLAGPFGGRRLDSKGFLEIVRTRFREELDYALEAERMRWFRSFHAGDPHIRVPKVIDDRSTSRVLTSELIEGKRFTEACAASEPERRAWAETMWRFVFRGNLVGGRFNADPHPGNYFFHDEGAVTFIDYGCVQPIPPREMKPIRVAHRAAIAGDLTTFLDAGREMMLMKPGPLEKMALEYFRLCFDPIFGSPYHIVREWTASLVETMKTMALAARKVPDDQIFTMPPEMVFMNRLQFGFYSVLARLDVSVDYRQVEAAFFHEVT